MIDKEDLVDLACNDRLLQGKIDIQIWIATRYRISKARHVLGEIKDAEPPEAGAACQGAQVSRECLGVAAEPPEEGEASQGAQVGDGVASDAKKPEACQDGQEAEV